MSTTVQLFATASAYITNENRDTNRNNINTLTKASYLWGSNAYLCLIFEGINPQYQYRAYSAPKAYTYAKQGGTGETWKCNYYLCAPFDPTTVTWNTMPSRENRAGYFNNTYITGAGWSPLSLEPTTDSSQEQYRPGTSPAYFRVSYSSDFSSLTIHGSASSNRPYIEVEIGDTDEHLTFESLSPADGGVVVSAMDSTFSWTTGQSAPTPTDIAQTEAVLRWKKPADADWTEIEISGNVKEYTFPANTFPGGKILWQVEITDVTGHTETSQTMTAYTTVALPCSGAAILLRGYNYNIPYATSETFAVRNLTERHLVAQFPSPSEALRYYRLVQTRFRAVIGTTDSAQSMNYLHGALPDADVDGLVDSDVTRVTGKSGYSYLPAASDGGNPPVERSLPDGYTCSNAPAGASKALKAAIASRSLLNTHLVDLYAITGNSLTITGDLYLDVAYDDTELILSNVIQSNSPTSGWMNPAAAQTFSWTLESYGDWPSVGAFIQQSASLFWKEADDAGWTEVPASGSEQSVTIPANTFPGGTISWYVTATDTNGTTTTTPTYTVSTTDTIPAAIPMDPVDIPVTGNKPIEFRWRVANDSGSLPTRSDLQVSEDGGDTWTDLATITGSGTSYTAPADSFTAEEVFWRVRAYNRDNVAGSWSAAVSFLNIAAPPQPSVTVIAVPFAVLQWQASGQQAYRVTIDGRIYGPYFGTDKTFTAPEYLADGDHTATVEVQGSNGLWSSPGETSFTVSNVPGDPITLTGAFGIDAELSWTTQSAAADFFVYRNGVRIGHTDDTVFTDRVFLGQADWFVINRLPDGNYSKSNNVSGRPEVSCSCIAAMTGDGWLELRLSENSRQTQEFRYSRTHSLRHVSGAAYPVLELSPYEDEAATYDAAFQDAESLRAFEDLRGRLVILKSRGDHVVIGALASVQKTVGPFFAACAFTISRVHWEDFVDVS